MISIPIYDDFDRFTIITFSLLYKFYLTLKLSQFQSLFYIGDLIKIHRYQEGNSSNKNLIDFVKILL